MAGAGSDYISVLKANGLVAFRPHGISMWPFIKDGKNTVVVVKKTDRLKPFDVALYQLEDGSAVLHRVVKVLEDGYQIRGDSHFQSTFVKEPDVLGVLDGFYKGKRFVKADDARYLKRVKRWYKDGAITRFRKKLFHYIHTKKLAQGKSKQV